jgi:hypothetical protein
MSYLSLLTEDEVCYICSAVPYQDSIKYFTKNSKGFNKIRPGFRPKAISKAEASKLLIGHSNKPFISDFIEEHISDWLSQIDKYCSKTTESGDSKDIALLNALPCSFFAENVRLYFKLVKEDYSEEYVELMSAAVKFLKEANGEQDRLSEELKERSFEIKKLDAESKSRNDELDKAKLKLNSRLLEIDELKMQVCKLESLQAGFLNDKHKVYSLSGEIQTYLATIDGLRKELSDIKIGSKQLEEQIRKEIERHKNDEINEQLLVVKPKCPIDIDEFKECLSYNFVNIGVAADSEYYPILTSHLGNVLFQGVPIIVNHSAGVNVIKCIANTIIGRPATKALIFNNDITTAEIGRFLSSSERIVRLDNFIGNFNETELISLFEKHKDKIIFLTFAYDRMLYYISNEFLRYCYYFNVNRIGALSINTVLTEDPAKIEEKDYIPQCSEVDNRFSNILREILRELGYPQSLIAHNCATITGEQDMCQLLAFDVLPYCVDVLRINPYNTSERLLRYAGDTGRCPCKKLFMEWFAQ